MTDEAYIRKLEAENVHLKRVANNWKENDKRRLVLTFIICKFYNYKFMIQSDIHGKHANVMENVRRNFKEELLKSKAVTKDIVDLMIKNDKQWIETLVNEIIGND